MLPYISNITHENAAKYQLDIYMKGSYEEKRVDEILITHDRNILCKVYMDDGISYVKLYDDRIELNDLSYEFTSNKKIRSLCRMISSSIGTLPNE